MQTSKVIDKNIFAGKMLELSYRFSIKPFHKESLRIWYNELLENEITESELNMAMRDLAEVADEKFFFQGKNLVKDILRPIHAERRLKRQETDREALSVADNHFETLAHPENKNISMGLIFKKAHEFIDQMPKGEKSIKERSQMATEKAFEFYGLECKW